MIHSERPHDVTFTSFVEETAKATKNEFRKDDSHNVPYSSSALSTVPPYWNHVIPILVRVNLMHKGNPMLVNLFLDPKSDCSYFIRSVANLFPDFTPDYRPNV